MRPQILYRVFKNFKLNTENPAYSAHLLTVLLLKFPRDTVHSLFFRFDWLKETLMRVTNFNGKVSLKIHILAN